MRHLFLRYSALALVLALPVAALAIEAPVALFLSDTHVVTLSFPSAVKYVDFGSADIVGGRTSHRNILSLRSSIPYFDETTASVVTSDGAYYSFILSYNPEPEHVAVDVGRIGAGGIISDATFRARDITLSDVKTSHFVLGARVTDILTGCDSIIADYADGIENIVRCKASASSFPETTLTLIDETGCVFPFRVTYSASPVSLNYQLADTRQQEDSPLAIFGEKSVNETELEALGRKVIGEGEKINTIGAFSQDMVFAMSSLYIKDDILMFRFDLENDTRIDYEVDFLKMYISDKKRSKKIALQEDEIKPIYVFSPDGDEPVIRGRETRSYVLFFRRFTIPVGRVLNIEAFERNGGRHIGFTIENSAILKAMKLE